MTRDGDAELNAAFRRYQETRGEAERDALYELCRKAGRRLRGRFTPEHKVGGDLYEDRFEDAFLKATSPELLPTIRPEDFNKLFFTILKRRFIDQAISESNHPTHSFGDMRGLPLPTVDVDSILVSDAKQVLLKHLASLSEMDRIYLANVLDGMTYEEMAEREKKPVGTIKSGINRARQHMRPIERDIREYNGLVGRIPITGDDVRQLGRENAHER